MVSGSFVICLSMCSKIGSDESALITRFLEDKTTKEMKTIDRLIDECYGEVINDSVARSPRELCSACDRSLCCSLKATHICGNTVGDIVKVHKSNIFYHITPAEETQAWTAFTDKVHQSPHVSKRGVLAWFEPCMARYEIFDSRIEGIIAGLERHRPAPLDGSSYGTCDCGV